MNKKEAMIEKLKGNKISNCPDCGELECSIHEYIGNEEKPINEFMCTKCDQVWAVECDEVLTS